MTFGNTKPENWYKHVRSDGNRANQIHRKPRQRQRHGTRPENRHVQFIAIGGTIGTGLFLGSGKSIALTGPSIILVYIGVGLIMFLLMRAIGE